MIFVYDKSTMRAVWIVAGIVVVAGGLIWWWVANTRRDITPTNTPTATLPISQTTQAPADAATAGIEANAVAGVAVRGTKLATNYYAFTKADYDALRAANMPLFLYFYANWCPICARQEPIVVATFNNRGVNGKIIGLRVNFNDSDTDADEKALAEEFGVRYQHTLFVLDANGNQVEKLIGDTSENQLNTAFAKAL